MAQTIGTFPSKEIAQEFVVEEGINEIGDEANARWYYKIVEGTTKYGDKLYRVKVPESIGNRYSRRQAIDRGINVLNGGIKRDISFDPSRYYVSVAREAGEKLSNCGILRDGTTFDDLRKVIVSGLSLDVTEYAEYAELHQLVKTNIFGRDFYLWVITKHGSPSGVQEHTVTVKDIAIPDEVHNAFGYEKRRGSFLMEIMYRLKKEFSNRIGSIRQSYDTTTSDTERFT